MKYSFIVPVYNRPDEVEELLESLTRQQSRDFEVIIVEDGSANPCREVCDKYAGKLDIHYYYKDNSGPGQSRNYGAERAQGEWLIILDSDVVVPEGYLLAVDKELAAADSDAFGGPDRAHESFTKIQKAISYSMTSFFTTGGIRGGKRKLDKFYPRSFNMGIKKEVYQRLGGFSKMRFGEDIDFSIRIFKAGCTCRLFPGAWVYHKRRTDFRKFWRQVYNSGIARINLYMKYSESLKPVHFLPAIFTLTIALCILLILFGSLFIALGFNALAQIKTGCANGPVYGIIFGILMLLAGTVPPVLYSLLIFIDSGCKNRSITIGFLSILAAFIQLTGYGCGFIQACWRRCLLGKDEFQAFEKTFYK